MDVARSIRSLRSQKLWAESPERMRAVSIENLRKVDEEKRLAALRKAMIARRGKPINQPNRVSPKGHEKLYRLLRRKGLSVSEALRVIADHIAIRG